MVSVPTVGLPRFFYAIRKRPDTARRMIQEGTNVNKLFGVSAPLHYAIHECNLHLVQLLLEYGANVSPKNSSGTTPLLVACTVEKKSYSFCELLLKRGADCNFTNFENVTPFLKALQYQALKVVKLLLDHGADIAVVDNRGSTALHYAAQNPHVEVLEFVLDQGFDIEYCDSYDQSALFYAAYNKNFDGCELLLKRDAIVNRTSSFTGLTPLTDAICPRDKPTGQEVSVVRILLEYGAEVTQKGLRIAAGGNDGVMNTLMQHVAKMELLNSGISVDIRKIIDTENCYKRYYQTFLQELERLKTTKFYSNLSVFNILMDSETLISRYSKNKELVRAFTKIDFNNKFPIYFNYLKRRFGSEVEKQRFREAAAEILSDLLVFNGPSHPVIQNILCYLSVEDFQFLCSNFAAINV